MFDLNKSFIILRIIVLQGPGLPNHDPEEDLKSLFVKLKEGHPDLKFNDKDLATIHRNRTKKHIFIE